MEFNWDNIEESLEQNAEFLQDFLVDEIIKEGLLKTGALGKSVNVIALKDETKNETTYNVSMKDYGFYQDSGVMGSGPNKRYSPNPESYYSPTIFKFKKPSIPWRPRTVFSVPAAISIAQNGLRPRPFIKEAFARFEEKVGKDIPDAGYQDVDDNMTTLFMKSGAKVN